MDFLIITIELDPHTDAVIKELNKKGYSVLRLNTDSNPQDYTLTCDNNDIIISDKYGRIFSTKEGQKIGYYRKPTKRNINTKSATSNFISAELNGFYAGLYSHPKITWINNRYNILSAQSKLGQISVANDIGFNTAQTIITNDHIKARKFCEDNNWKIAMKPVATPSISDEKTSFHFFTIKLNKEELEPLIDRVKYCPVIIQNYIEKSYELRITFFADKVFCCKLDSQHIDEAKLDWRAIEPTKINHQIIPINKDIEAKCLKMLNYYNLSFGTFDFIVQPNNEIVFLELNPNGQWYWIELITGEKMAFAMADLLISHKEDIKKCRTI